MTRLKFHFFQQLWFIFTLGISGYLNSAALFTDDFEGVGGVVSSPNPSWAWEAPYSESNRFGMMFGERDIYSVSDKVANSGRSSLRINFNGRNNFCNICGSETLTVTESNLVDGCFDTSGEREDAIYNSDNAFSVWQVRSSSPSRVCVDMSAPIEQPLLDIAPNIALGDELKLPYVCGVNGSIGSNISRRSDCDLAINYLEGIRPTDFEFGETLSRRMYVYIPSETILPSVTIKLGYAKFEASNIVPFVSSSRGARFEIDGNAILGFLQTDLFFERNRWMYIEEVYTRETAANADDGRFLLYAGFAGDDLTIPVLSASGLRFGELKSLSIIGNWPHRNEASGYLYIDDVAVGNEYIGPVDGGVASRPNPPTNVAAEVMD